MANEHTLVDHDVEDGGSMPLASMPKANGWMGVWSQVEHAVRTVGGDLEKDGKPRIEGVMLFMGLEGPNVETVVPSSARYFIDGQECALAVLMNATSYGLRNVVVIG